MSNLGLHLIHNRHHTLFPVQEEPYSHSGLHLHDQQPTYKDFSKDWLFYINLHWPLQPYKTPLYRLYNRKTLNIGAQNFLQIHAYHWLQISQISGFGYNRLQVRLPVDLHSVSIRSSHAHTLTS
jgi:hypothetical protein